jgi:hypothetical protein
VVKSQIVEADRAERVPGTDLKAGLNPVVSLRLLERRKLGNGAKRNLPLENKVMNKLIALAQCILGGQ